MDDGEKEKCGRSDVKPKEKKRTLGIQLSFFPPLSPVFSPVYLVIILLFIAQVVLFILLVYFFCSVSVCFVKSPSQTNSIRLHLSLSLSLSSSLSLIFKLGIYDCGHLSPYTTTTATLYEFQHLSCSKSTTPRRTCYGLI